MPLWTDGLPSTTEDLRAYESSILETARTEGIDLTTKLSVAQREISGDIYLFLVEQTASEGAGPTVSMDQIALTAELSHWHVLRSIELTYRDAFHSQLNDRHRGKWEEYQRLAREAGGRAFESGIGIVNVPVTKARSVTVSNLAGVMTPGVYDLRVSWQNAAGQEGSPSDASVFVSESGSIPLVEPGAAPRNSSGWNVYASLLGQTPTKQNSVPLSAASNWAPLPVGFVIGQPIGSGQRPDRYLRPSQTMVRA